LGSVIGRALLEQRLRLGVSARSFASRFGPTFNAASVPHDHVHATPKGGGQVPSEGVHTLFMFSSKHFDPSSATTSTLFWSRSFTALICASLLLTAPGCKKASKDKAKPGQASDTASAAVTPGKSCEEFSKKACAVSGEKSGGCSTLKAAAEVLSDAACAQALKDFAITEEKLKSQASKCDELVDKLCTGVGKDTETCKMVTEKTKEFPPEQCVSMLANVDSIVLELKKQEQANQPLTTEQAAKVAAGDVPSFGPANAKVTVVEFSDFECPYCSRAASVATQVKGKYADRVRFVFRQFPLSFHDNARIAAQASLEAHKQGKFWEFHDKLFANQRALDRASLEGYAKEVKLDLTKFKGALDANMHDPQVQADLDLGGEVAVQGTPTMFVNGKRVENPTDFDAVSQAIESALGS
jgi:protein-disulfide isomerase